MRTSMEVEQKNLGRTFSLLVDGKSAEVLDVEYSRIKSKIIIWNVNRNNVAFNTLNELDMLESEAKEAIDGLNLMDESEKGSEDYLEGEFEYIDGLCDTYVVYTGTLAKSGRVGVPLRLELEEWYEDYCSIPLKVQEAGFDFSLCMEETIKEINAREQDPKQAERWKNGDIPIGEKWQKNLSQDPKTIYKANYEKCRL